MPTLLITLIPALLQAGVQAAQLLEGLMAARSQIASGGPGRPDIDDATMSALDSAIAQIQAQIDEA